MSTEAERAEYFRAYYEKHKDAISEKNAERYRLKKAGHFHPREPLPAMPRTICVECNERQARKNRRLCSRCEGSASISRDRRGEGARFERPDDKDLVDTGIRIDDARGAMLTPEGNFIYPVPASLARVYFFDQDPQNPTLLRVLDGRGARAAG